METIEIKCIYGQVLFAHTCAIEKGFYQKPVELGTALMLITSELSEALEADRNDRRANLKAYELLLKDSDNLGFSEEEQNEYLSQNFKLAIKDTLEDELADAVIRFEPLFVTRSICS